MTSGHHEPVGALAFLRPLNVLTKSGAENRDRIAWLALCVGVAVLIALGYVWLRLQVVDLGYRVSATRQIIDKLDQEGRELTVEVATLSAAPRIEEMARLRLGMIRPEKGQEAVLP